MQLTGYPVHANAPRRQQNHAIHAVRAICLAFGAPMLRLRKDLSAPHKSDQKGVRSACDTLQQCRHRCQTCRAKARAKTYHSTLVSYKIAVLEHPPPAAEIETPGTRRHSIGPCRFGRPVPVTGRTLSHNLLHTHTHVHSPALPLLLLDIRSFILLLGLVPNCGCFANVKE